MQFLPPFEKCWEPLDKWQEPRTGYSDDEAGVLCPYCDNWHAASDVGEYGNRAACCDCLKTLGTCPECETINHSATGNTNCDACAAKEAAAGMRVVVASSQVVASVTGWIQRYGIDDQETVTITLVDPLAKLGSRVKCITLKSREVEPCTKTI